MCTRLRINTNRTRERGRHGVTTAVLLLVGLGLALSSGAADDSELTSALRKPSPEGAADLRVIQEQVTAVAEKVVPCTVALQVGGAHASGVIVSPDGYVLTAAHVIGRPDRDVRIIFPNGSTARGKTLGLNPEVDGGLVQITDDGPWPYAPIAPREETPKPGDWCLATGHPGGFQTGRTPPVRLGRVISAERAVIRTDFRDTMAEARSNTVRVKCDGEDIALGTIVGADGWILTKASVLTDSDKIVCVLTGNRELPARLVGSDSGYDLALLRVEATELKAVELEHASELRPGTWLASAGPSAEPLAIGVVSVAKRPIGRSPGVLGVLIDDRDEGPTVRQVMPMSGAAAAGIKEGDLITHIGTEAVRSMVELQAAVRKHRVGDVLKATIERDDMKLELAVRLGMPEDSFSAAPGPRRGSPDADAPGPNRDRHASPEPVAPLWRGPLSNRRDDFPAAIQHDTILRPNDCGGPVIDVDGHVVGINIARADRTASYTLPSAAVLAVIDKLKSGR